MTRKILIVFFILLLVACSNSELPAEAPKEDVDEVIEVVKEVKEEESLEGEELVKSLLAGKGDILDIKRVFDPEKPYFEVLLRVEKDYLIYKIDPLEKEIISVEEKENQIFDLEQAFFRAKELLPGADGLHAMVYKDGLYVLTILRGEEAFEVALDKLGLFTELLGPVEQEEIEGRVRMDLFQAIEKFHVIYGDIDLREIYYRSGNDYSAFIVMGGYQEFDGQEVYRTFEINTYDGVIWEK